MKATAILSSDLLDIIFENRNKDYGAYDLRKNYPMRLAKAIMAVVALALIFSFYMIIPKNKTVRDIVYIAAPELPPISEIKAVEQKKKIENQVKSKVATQKNFVPVIVPNDQVDSTNKPVELVEGVAIGNLARAGDTLIGVPGPPDVPGTPPGEPRPVEVVAVINKDVPMENPDVEPQYPGGMKEFVKYLERNLQSPEDLEGGVTIAVRVKFVVNYDGTLKSFSVVQTGGKTFDDEVLRVLKRMPKWLPGKARGENVSVFYTVPVKFTTPG